LLFESIPAMASKSTLVYYAIAAVLVLGIAFLATRPASLPDPGDIKVEDGIPSFVNDAGHAVRGSPNAKVHMVEFSDFQCPFCKGNEAALTEVLKAYPGLVSLEYRHFPLTQVHGFAAKAAEAYECALDQGPNKAWALHDVMFDRQPALDVPQLKSYARALGIDGAAFDACLDSGKKAELVARDASLGVKLGVESTPSVFIEGTPLVGQNPAGAYKAVIDPLLGR
jgi:protein-disulfide isomerase